MKDEKSFLELADIISRIEKWKSLNKKEELLWKVIIKLKQEKHKDIKINKEFKKDLKKNVLSEYSSLYPKRSFLWVLKDFFNLPVVKFSYTFALVLIMTFWAYNTLFVKMGSVSTEGNLSSWTQISDNSMDYKSIPEDTQSKSAEPVRKMKDIENWYMKGDASDEVSNWLQMEKDESRPLSFWSSKVSSALKWDDSNADIAIKTLLNRFTVLFVLIVSILIIINLVLLRKIKIDEIKYEKKKRYIRLLWEIIIVSLVFYLILNYLIF